MDTFINGNQVSFADTTMSANGRDVSIGALKSVNFTSSLEPGLIQGNGTVYAAGKTAGNYTATADFEMLLSESRDFEADLTNDGETKPLTTDFDMQISYALPDESFTTTVNLRGCRIKSRAVSAANGSDAIYMKYELVVMKVEIDGLADA